MEYFLQYIVAALLFVIIDAVWLTTLAPKFYRKHMGSMLRKKPDLFAAVIFYAVYILGIVVFALSPALREGSVWYALGLGGLLGFVMYATYDLTNQSTLKNWPKIVTVVDLAWGTFITATVSLLAFLIFR
ncbi:MAG: DUF2177 family protein [Candidatus Saccharimonadales bacterium]